MLFIDVITGRPITRENARYLIGPKVGEVTLFEPAEFVPAFAKHDDAECITLTKGYPYAEAFYAVEPTKEGFVAGFTPSLVHTFWSELERRGTLSWADAKQLLGHSVHVRDFAQQFGTGDEFTFYISRAASEAWTRLTRYLAE